MPWEVHKPHSTSLCIHHRIRQLVSNFGFEYSIYYRHVLFCDHLIVCKNFEILQIAAFPSQCTGSPD